jgi:hypothetical protein
MRENTVLNELIERYGLNKLNTMTKYPSIYTYHTTAERGSLSTEHVDNKTFASCEKIYITEKIDGTNSRVVLITDAYGQVADYIVGSREDFLYAKDDRIINPALGIVSTLQTYVIPKFAFCETIVGKNTLRPNHMYIFYGETYGGKINAAKQYTNIQAYNFRAFDIVEMDIPSVKGILSMQIEDISSWREHGGLPFVSVTNFVNLCNILSLNRVPYIKEMNGSELPTNIKDVFSWLQNFEKSNATIEPEYTGLAKAEGVVVRTESRDLIRKIRFEDYEKTKKLHPEYF